MNPWAQLWVILHLPGWLVPAAWAGLAGRLPRLPRRVLTGGALLLLLVHGAEAARVASGGYPLGVDALVEASRWTILGLLLLTTRGAQPWSSTRRDTVAFEPVSTAFAAGYLAIGAWLPGLVVLSRRRLWRSPGLALALAAHAGAVLLRQQGMLDVATWLGFLGLSTDGTTVAAVWAMGLVECAAWIWVLVVMAGDTVLPRDRDQRTGGRTWRSQARSGTS